MKKTLILTVTFIFLCIATYIVSSYYFGLRAEQTLSARRDVISNTSGLTVEKYNYNRSLFSSEEEITIRLLPQLADKIGDSLPEQLRTLLKDPIIVKSHVKHGPWIGNRVGIAKVNSEFIFTDAQKRTLKQFFDDDMPVSLTDTISLSGSGRLYLKVLNFEYKELSGIEIKWGGLNINTQYKPLYSQYESHITAPSLEIILADQGDISLKKFDYLTHTARVSPIHTGDSTLSLEKFELNWNQQTKYRIRLNDLVNMLGNLQVGGFINPSVELPPTHISIDHFMLNTSLELDNEFVDAQGKIGFDKMVYAEETYGPMVIDVSAEHLHAGSLKAVRDKLSNITIDPDKEEWREQVIAIAHKEGLPLFANDPKFSLRTFNFNMPSGKISLDGFFSLNDIKERDLDDVNLLVPKINAEFQYSIPMKVVEDLAQSQVSTLFAVDENNNNQHLDEIRETIQIMTNNVIDNLVEQGYLKRNNNVLSGTLSLKDGSLAMNGMLVDLNNEQDDDNEEDFEEDVEEKEE
ncbi:MAG: YdgA family protein [Neisseriaceae bacterium]|nr:YdgA family protein [Neisseriaceae bacterium]